MKRKYFLATLGALAGSLVFGKTPAVLPIKKDVIFTCFIRGYQYHKGKKHEQHFKPNQPLQLVREPENEYDPFAIAVYYKKIKLGYLPAEHNAILNTKLALKHNITAKLIAVNLNAPDWERVEINITEEFYA